MGWMGVDVTFRVALVLSGLLLAAPARAVPEVAVPVPEPTPSPAGRDAPPQSRGEGAATPASPAETATDETPAAAVAPTPKASAQSLASLGDPPPEPSKPRGRARTPWSLELYLGAGSSSGSPAAPAQGVYGPAGMFSLGLGGSLWFVHVGTGFEVLSFDDRSPLVQDVYSTDSGQETVHSSASAPAGYFEIGLNYGLHIGLGGESFIEVLPAVSYGLNGVGPLGRSVGNCFDCESQDISVDYLGGDYVGFMLGAMWGSGMPLHGSFGLTPVFRYYLHPGDARLRSQFLVALTLHIGSGT